MSHRKRVLTLLIVSLLIAALTGSNAQEGSPAEEAAPSQPLVELLPDRVAGIKAAGEIQQYEADRLRELVGDRGEIYQEYLVTGAASREYGEARAEVFKAANPFAAYGLFTYNLGLSTARLIPEQVGSGGAKLAGSFIFWKGIYFVRITGRRESGAPHAARLASAIAQSIKTDATSASRPPLLDSLPEQAGAEGRARYFLGPESLNTYVERGREMFGFSGNAEAVMAEYDLEAQAAARPRVKLIIVEYHTPQFAADAFRRLNDYIESLSAEEQSRTIIKREGNYIVKAENVEERQRAQQLVDSISYPYAVKWLRNPLWPTNDPFRTQKAAQMLISTFGLLGLILLTVLVGGTAFGTIIFIKRRRQQQEIFSDAGGMLRLELDPVEATLLGLPPKRVAPESSDK